MSFYISFAISTFLLYSQPLLFCILDLALKHSACLYFCSQLLPVCIYSASAQINLTGLIFVFILWSSHFLLNFSSHLCVFFHYFKLFISSWTLLIIPISHLLMVSSDLAHTKLHSTNFNLALQNFALSQTIHIVLLSFIMSLILALSKCYSSGFIKSIEQKQCVP